MSKQKPKREQPKKEPRRKAPTLVLELPLVVNEGQAKRIRGHLEAGRAHYNAMLSEGQKQERLAAFSTLRQRYGFWAYALHEYAKTTRVCWIADHLDAVLAQTLATRAYRALNSSLENKRNDTGLRF